MSDTSQVPGDKLLLAIASELKRMGSDIVGQVQVDGESLSACQDQLRLRVEIFSDHPMEAEILHAHVVARLGGESGQELDACIIGIGDTEDDQAEDAARNWQTLVGGPVLSLLTETPLVGTRHFDEASAHGVAGAHGFVGPMMGRLLDREFDWGQLEEVDLFRFAQNLAPAEMVQLAKVTLHAEGGVWSRSLEINGHAVSHFDADWKLEPDPPREGAVTQFALFHFAHDPNWVVMRQKVDDAICSFVAAFAESRKIDEAYLELVRQGVEGELAHNVFSFASLAFSRSLLEQLGARYADSYCLIGQGGSVTRDHLLLDQPVYARSLALSHDFKVGPEVDAFKDLALLNTEFQRLNQLMNDGFPPGEIELPPPVMLQFGVDEESVEIGTRKIVEGGT